MVYAPKIYDRQKLYDEVWKEPITVVAKRYGVSDVAIHKICKRLNVPVPGRGYWAKIAAGAKNLEIIPLPKHSDQQAVLVYRNVNQELKNIQDKTADLTFLNEEERQALDQVCSRIAVPGNINMVHPLVAKANIDVSKDSHDRAKRIMDTLIRALEELGYAVTNEDKDHSFYVIIRGEKIGFKLYEHWKQIGNVLTLSIDSYWIERKNWNDGKLKKIEDCIGDFIFGLVKAAEINRLRHEEAKIKEQQRLEEERERRKREEIQHREIKRFKELEENALRWHKAQIIRNFINAVESDFGKTNESEKIHELTEWINWAKEKADWLDPLIAKKDTVLGIKYNQSLMVKKEENF
jgi:hypothetical protein